MAMSSQSSRLTAFTLQDHIAKVFSASGTWDADSIADGDEVVDTLTVTGVALGDFCLASCSITPADLTVTAFVSAANTVTVSLANNTGSAVNLDSAVFKVLVLRPAV